ncbi:beta-phosphoglucomutase [Lacticaseibacillus mingshuiensis]|uniref:Beta-phosphoglucomutase n=1 Tax=Lacticaseibacillus mingshuiensis TaxID=2799574 RepID=A0ABW4CKK8_9LACO|nr:beta-phosphoglucomutase [Lacticaseibacillus mingshuiensis]
MLKGLLFDLDGVLTDSAKFHLAAWGKVAESIGITLPPEANDGLRGRSRMDSLDFILRGAGQEDRFTEAEKEALATKKNAMYVEAIKSMTPADILPGIPQLLADAKTKQLKMIIASASKNAPTILRQLKIAADFDGVVDPATLHRGKPDPEIYVRAQELAGLQADEVVSFEDASAGVAAIKAAGQFAVGIGDKTVLAQADYIVPTTAALQLSQIEAAFNAQH